MNAFAIDGLQTTSVNGARLAYVRRGAGQSVVFVHGGYSDLRTWLPQLDPFSQEYHAVAYSRRYARPNEDILPGQDDQLEPHVDDLRTLLRELELAPAHLVGNSWGAFICLLTALREPELVRTLVLGEAPVLPLFISNSPGPAEISRLLLSSPIDAVRILRFGAGVVGRAEHAYRQGHFDEGTRLFVSGVLGSRAYRRIPEARKQQMRANHTADAAQLLGAGFPPLAEAEIRQINTPTLLVSGANSPAVLRRTLTLKLKSLLAHVEHEEILGASHIMHEDNPEAFNRATLAFLRRH